MIHRPDDSLQGFVLSVLAILGLVLAVILARFYQRPGEGRALVLTGRAMPPARRVTFVGPRIRMPYLERFDWIDIIERTLKPTLTLTTKPGVLVDLEFTLRYQVSKDPDLLLRAMRLIHGRHEEETDALLEKVLTSTCQNLLATLTVEEVAHNRSRFANILKEEAELTLSQLGLVINTLSLRSAVPHTGIFDLRMDSEALPPPVENRRSEVVEVLGFLPAAAAKPIEAAADDSASGQRLRVVVDSVALELRTTRETLIRIRFDEPFTVMLSYSEAGAEPLLNLDVRQQWLGTSVRVGLSSTARSFAAPITGLARQGGELPRLEEADMLKVLGALRAAMQSRGEERWQG